MKKVFFLLAVLILISCSKDSSTVEVEKSAWQNDLDYLSRELPSRHKNLFTKISSDEFNNQINSLSEKVNSLDDSQIYSHLLKIISSVGDAHTFIKPSGISDFYFFQIRGYWFEDGYYIVAAGPDTKELLGQKLLKIGNYEIDRIYEMMKEYIPHENEQQVKKTFPQMLSFAQLLQHLGVIEKYEEAEFEFSESGKVKLSSIDHPSYSNIYMYDLFSERNITLPMYMNNIQNYFFDYLENEKIVYFQYYSCIDDTAMPFSEFNKKLFNFIENNEVDKLVIDLRNNGGGSSIVLIPFIEKISKHEKLNKEGKIFTVIGRRTFSSAVSNALQLQANTNSIFVGEPTSGKPNHFGEVRSFYLPNSNYQVFYSTKYFRYTDNDTESFSPDHYIGLTFDEYKNGVDPVLEYIINQ